MKRKTTWLAFACLFTIMLILTSCGGSLATTPLNSAITTSPTTAVTTTHTTASDKPQYGGTITRMLASDSGIFDPVTQGQLIGPACAWFVNEQWISRDWSKGLLGTGQTDWMNAGQSIDDFGPYLAESYTMPEPGVIVLKVRQGVHYALNTKSEASRLVGGREMTADDWVKNMNMFINHPGAWLKTAQPVVADDTEVKKTGPWEVTFTCKKDPLQAWFWLAFGGGYYFQFPPELWDKYPNLQDWRNSVGTGAFMLTDYVASSSITLVKNSSFWGTNPIGPGKGDRLPYIDRIKTLILPDMSTRLAALRTGKIDILDTVFADDAVSLKKTTPDLKSAKYLPGQSWVIAMRTDLPELPFKDRRVRQALMLATDFQGMLQSANGDGEILVFPINKSFKRAYVPFDQLPTGVQELYSYNPDKAKSLLKEAGYPDGFKTSIICANEPNSLDVMSIYKAMWAKVNVDLTIDSRELAIYARIAYALTAKEMIFTANWGIFPVYLDLGGLAGANSSHINTGPAGLEPVIQAIHDRVQSVVIQDPAAADKIIHDEFIPYVLENSWYIPTVQPYQYNFWWPWVKNYYGASNAMFFQYFWVDQTLKRSMTGE